MTMKDFVEAFRKAMEPGTTLAMLIYGALGLIIALLMLLIGFWKTMLVVACCLIGCFIGGVRDKKEFIRLLLARFFRPME